MNPDLKNKLIELLSQCSEFETDRALRDVFTDRRLFPWKMRLPQAMDIKTRVTQVMNFLFSETHEDGQNGLVLLLQVLPEQGRGIKHYQDLATLADALLEELSPITPVVSPPITLETGTMKPESPFYIERAGDTECWQLVTTQSTTIVIKAPWQTGKSSFLARLAHRVERNLAKRAVFIDFQEGFADVLDDFEQFLKRFCAKIAEELELPDNIAHYWKRSLPHSQNCGDYISKYIMPELNRPLVIILDEVGLLAECPFKTEFYRMLRVWHNNRARKANFAQISLILSISTETHRLIDNPNESPFNVAHPINLLDFNLNEVTELNKRYAMPLQAHEVVRLTTYLGGHPLLTRLAFYHVGRGLNFEQMLQQAISVDSPFAQPLNHYRHIIQREAILKDALKELSLTGRIEDEESLYRLEALGLIKQDRKKVYFRNPLFADYFKEWL